MLLLAHRFNVIMSSVANLSWTFFQLLSLSVLFEKIPNVEGWSYQELVLLLAFSQLSYYLSYVIFEGNLESVWRWISSGDFEQMLSKPINIKFYSSFRQLLISPLFSMVTTVVPLFIYAFNIGEDINIHRFLYATVILFISMVLIYFIELCIAGLNFFIDDAVSIKSTMIDGSRDLTRIPFELYPKGIRLFFTYILPLGFTAYFPTLLYKGGQQILELILIELILGVVLFLLSKLVWSRGLKRFSGVSS